MSIVQKSELTRPFVVNGDNAVSSLFDCIIPFADAGNVGDKPAVIPDLLGNHDINMTYGAVGELVDDGDLLLADNGNGQTNTYGDYQNINSTWSNSLSGRSRIYVIDTVFNANTRNYQYLFSGVGLKIWWTKSSNELGIYIENISSHRVTSNYTPTNGERLTIVIQLDVTNVVARVIVNGVALSTTTNGNPFSTTYSKPIESSYMGRHTSWHYYYGWDGKVNLFAMGYNFNGNELTEQALIDLSLNPYDLLSSTAVVNTPFNSVNLLVQQGVQGYAVAASVTAHWNVNTVKQTQHALPAQKQLIKHLTVSPSEQVAQASRGTTALFNQMTSAPAEQKTFVQQIVAHSNTWFDAVLATQQQTCSLTDVVRWQTTHSVTTTQPVKAGLISMSIGGEHLAASSQQVLQAMTASANAIKQLVSVTCEQVQKSLASYSAVNQLVRPVAAQQHSESTSNELMTGSLLQGVTAKQQTFSSLSDIAQVLDYVTRLAEQYAVAGVATTIEVSTYSSVAAFQQAEVTKTYIYSAAMPDIDLESVLIISLTPTCRIESLNPTFIIQ